MSNVFEAFSVQTAAGNGDILTLVYSPLHFDHIGKEVVLVLSDLV